MRPFRLVRPGDLDTARRMLADGGPQAVLRAGGVDLLDRWKEGIERPQTVVDLRAVLAGPDGATLAGLGVEPTHLRAGALVTVDELAAAPVPPAFSALVEASGGVANPAVRRLATVGGNLLQRPRCWYFRHPDLVCLKKGGSMCLAAQGKSRYNAVLGGGPSYIVHPSTLATALALFRGTVTRLRADGARDRVPLGDFFVTPKQRLDAESILEAGEIVTALSVEAPAGVRSGYDAVRERRLVDWPYVEAAVALRREGDTLHDVRVVLGQVAPVPWRARAAEALLEGRSATHERLHQAAEAAFEGAEPLSDNAGKVAVGRGLVRRLLHRVARVPLPD